MHRVPGLNAWYVKLRAPLLPPPHPQTAVHKSVAPLVLAESFCPSTASPGYNEGISLSAAANRWEDVAVTTKADMSFGSTESTGSLTAETSRRELLQLGAVVASAALLPAAAQAAKAPKGFNPVQDLTDNYQFLYPFGWQEVTITGADVVYKDVVEPLESVSVTITPTDRKEITDFGDINEVNHTTAALPQHRATYCPTCCLC
eukprot:GHUV01052105.1.p1 GENE.GHUV01052105.1~~GHUV01052105.1.p1  ORF type:complete len:203 (-),score=46.73 GHUV01052105.1:674-1282(-)